MTRFVWPLLLVLTGCSLGQPDPGKAFYVLETPVLTSIASSSGAGETLRIARSRVTPPFDSREFQYRVAANQIESSYYHNWADAPAALVTGAVIEALGTSGAFHVVDASSAAAATRILELDVTELSVDVTTSRPQAVMSIRATLLDRDGTILRTLNLHRAETAASAEAPDVVAAWSVALGEIVAELMTLQGVGVATRP